MVPLYSCVLSGEVGSIGTLPQHPISCGCLSQQKLLGGYMKCVRVTFSWGTTSIAPGNNLRAYFDLRVMVRLTIVGLKPTGKAAQL